MTRADTPIDRLRSRRRRSDPSRPSATAASAVSMLVMILACACTPATSNGSSSGPTTPASGPPSVSVGPITEPSLPSDPPPTPADASRLRTSQSVISGRSGSVSWRVRIPTFSGAPAAAAVNRRVRAAVNGMIDQTRREGRHDKGVKRRLEGEGTVVTNDGRTAQVTITYSDYLAGTAHPSDYVTTTVVDVVRRRPITLAQVFTDPPAAYRKLKPAILGAAGEQRAAIDPAGLAPKRANWANWQTNDTGMIFVFGDYQLGIHGLPQYAVAWSTVEPLMTSYAKRVLAPQ